MRSARTAPRIPNGSASTAPRHPLRGLARRDVPRHGAGAEVAEVAQDASAEQVGLDPGDILLQLGEGAVFGNRKVMFFLRERGVGDEVDAVWAHDGSVHRGTGRLTQRDVEIFAPSRLTQSIDVTFSTNGSRLWREILPVTIMRWRSPCACRACSRRRLTTVLGRSIVTMNTDRRSVAMGRGVFLNERAGFPSVRHDAGPNREQYLRPAQAAAMLHVSPQTVRRWAVEGRLPCVFTAGGHRRFRRREVQQLRQELEHEALPS